METWTLDIIKELSAFWLLIVLWFFGFKYFITQLEKKEETNQKFLEKMIEVIDNNNKALSELKEEIRKK